MFSETLFNFMFIEARFEFMFSETLFNFVYWSYVIWESTVSNTPVPRIFQVFVPE